MKRAILVTGLLLVSSGLLAPGLRAQGFTIRPAPSQRESVTWDRRAAGHLMRRAGFSASPTELDRLVEQGLDATLNELLYPETIDDSVMEAGLEQKQYELTRVNPNNGRVLANNFNMNRWWLYRLIHSRRQLREKMSLFWHDHFATSVAEVRFVRASTGQPLMMIQNELFRSYALGDFKGLVSEIARDPAMLLWLDNFLNVVGEPNENWSRELMELFTMGVDQYTQEDIEEAARAFTGWSFRRDRSDQGLDYQFEFHPELHDYGQKTFLGKTGNWDGDDIIDMIFQEPVTAEFIARKLWEYFVYTGPSEGLVKDLGRVFRDSGYDVRTLMRAIFRHPEFFSDRAYRALIKSPTELLVGFTREMELSDPTLLPFYNCEMTQNLFAPPDVGGWTSGVGWINTSTWLFRSNFITDATSNREGERINLPRGCIGGAGRIGRDSFEIPIIDFQGIVEEYGLTSSDDLVNHFTDRLIQGDFTFDEGLVLEQYMKTGPDGAELEFDISNPEMFDTKVPGLLFVVAIMPVYQLN